MGYALFANRKLFYTNLVFSLQQKLDNISQQRQSLINFSANISDGKVTVDEIASDPTNFGNYAEYLQGSDAYMNTDDADGGAGSTITAIGDFASAQGYSEEQMQAIANLLNESVSEEYAKQYSKKLEAVDNQLDLEQKKIETKLTAAQKQLEAVEEAEGQAIEKATPKYSGIQ